MFLHGWGQSGDCFGLIGEYLSKEYRVTLVDFEGFGKSPKPAVPMSVCDYAGQIIDLIKQNYMKDVVVIAHSFGGRVALEAAYKYPHFFSKLILTDIAGVKPKRGVGYYLKIYSYKLRKKLKLNTKNAGSSDYRNSDEIMRQTLVNVVNYDQTYQLSSIKLPTLLVWGALDGETPMYMAKTLNKKLLNSRLVVFEDCGHFAFSEDSYRFILLIKEFIEDV